MRAPLPRPRLGDGAVLVRALEAGDAAAVAAAVPAGQPGVWEATPGPYTLADATRILAEWEQGRRSGERVALAVLAGPEATGAAPNPRPDELLGGVVLMHGAPAAQVRADVRDQLEAAYWIRPPWRGRGYAARALSLAAGWALSLPGVSRVWLEIDRGHLASRLVARRSLFSLVGLRVRALEPGADAGDVLIYERIEPAPATASGPGRPERPPGPD